MNSSRTIATALLIAFAAATLTAHDERPQKMRRMQFDADKAVMIDEAGMVVVEKDGKLAVEFIAPKDRRPAAAAGLDIAEGDEIGMAGGKRIATAKLLREAYEAVKPGEEFKLGLRRDGKAFIATIVKMDPKDLPKRTVVRSGPGGSENPNRDILPAVGIAIEQTGGKVVITETLPNAPEGMSDGDVIASLNGTAVKSLDDFRGVFDGVEIGGELKFGLSRGGKTVTVVMKRPKPQGMMMIK